MAFKLIVWKNLVIRKRHFILTACEIVLPVVLFFLIAYTRSKIDGLNKVEITSPTIHEKAEISNHFDVDTFIYYTPQNEYFRAIMKKVQERFQIYTNNIKGFDSERELLDYFTIDNIDSSKSVVAVVFNNEANTTSFDYTLRYYKLETPFWHTNELYADELFSSDSANQYVWTGFLSMQMALDTAFIEQKSGQNLFDKFQVFMQQFPFPPYRSDVALNDMFMNYLPYITLFSFIFVCPAVLNRVVEEKQSGIKELMKMVGMKPWMLWLGWFIHGMLTIVTSVIIIVILMKVQLFGDVGYPPIEYADGTIYFVFLILYCSAAIVFCFAISTLFSNASYAMIFGILFWILSYAIPKHLLDAYKVSLGWQCILGLFPNMALHFGYGVIGIYEKREVGVQWNNLHLAATGGTGREMTMLTVFLLLMFDIVFYMALTYYLDSIHPGPYGIAKSLTYPIKNFRNCLRRRKTSGAGEVTPLSFVESGINLQTGILVSHVTKKYGNKIAVENLNLRIYKDQITVLLGENGAGKSTTMAMITGMIGTTKGSIIVDGKDIKKDMDEFRRSLGLCPQHNLLFNDLNVLEHLKFFGGLKGLSLKDAEKAAEKLLSDFNMLDKKYEMAQKLSGGMKRKLCLAMAVIGDSKVLILDEPTSGMDPESRRHLWNMLLSWRKSKTILITTHFMEEADALGDRIAIMAAGKLLCYNTPMDLKNTYGTGYHLTVLLESIDDEIVKQLEEVIKHKIPDAKRNSVNGYTANYILPIADKPKFQNLFESLEDKKEILKIQHILITITTLEDVFLKSNLIAENDEGKSPVNTQGRRETTRSGWWSTTKALVTKRKDHLKRKLFQYVIPILLSIGIFVLSCYLSTSGPGNLLNNNPNLNLSLSTYGSTKVYYNGTSNSDVEILKRFYHSIVAQESNIAEESADVIQSIIDEGVKNIAYYKKHMVAGAEFQKTNDMFEITALYSGAATHSAPISLNLVMDALAKRYLGEDYSIKLYNWPLPQPLLKLETTTQVVSETQPIILWLMLVPTGLLFVLGGFILFPYSELETNFIDIQFMCGVNSIHYWLLNMLFDLVLFTPTILIIGLLSVICFVVPYDFGLMMLLLYMYACAAIPYSYLFSRRKTAASGIAVLTIVSLFSGVIPTVAVALLKDSSGTYKTLGDVLEYVFLVLSPQFGLTYYGISLTSKTIERYNWEHMTKSQKSLKCQKDRDHVCCLSNSIKCQEFLTSNPITNAWYMLLVGLLYLILNALLDSYFAKRIWSKINSMCYSRVVEKSEDDTDNLLAVDVQSNKKNSMYVQNLKKSYGRVQAVKNVSFVAEKGICFGLLGVNGAGKSSTFKILVRESIQTGGSIKADDVDCDDNVPLYLKKLGYCPQNDSLNFNLTARQLLTFIAVLRGYPNNVDVVNSYLELFDLKDYADNPCETYSGGNKRKLSLAIAIIGLPPYILLDEPTNGVDPKSRRNFWNVLNSIKTDKQNKSSLIITSHSMAECEALCDEMVIMKNGTIARQGKLAALKQEIGGFTVMLKLKTETPQTDEVDGIVSSSERIIPYNIDDLKQKLQAQFNCELKDEHSGLLHYHIRDKNKRLSALFEEIETLKKEYDPLIADYSISNASLEDVFMQVARSDSKINK